MGRNKYRSSRSLKRSINSNYQHSAEFKGIEISLEPVIVDGQLKWINSYKSTDYNSNKALMECVSDASIRNIPRAFELSPDGEKY